MKVTTKKVGKALAYIQTKFDDLFDFGFRKLSNATKKELPEDTNKAKKILYKLGWYIGDVGKNYYKSYNKYKEEKAKSHKK